MLEWIKKQGVATWVLLAGAILTVVSMILYIVNSTTGYFAGSDVNALPIVFSVIAVLLICAIIAFSGKINHAVFDVLLVVIAVLLAVCIAQFIMGRTDVAGDQWFIPGMESDEKGACLNGAIVGVVFYCISALTVIAAAFVANFKKD